jgi:serine phosphatase RsbU (regulator of sigma subunit)
MGMENNLEQFRFAGYRVIEFPEQTRRTLKEVAERLLPHEDEIVRGWVDAQFTAWQPPGQTREQLEIVFADLFSGMLNCMALGRLEDAVDHLEDAGSDFAVNQFPFEALMISLHFLEESYLPFLLNPPSDNTLDYLIRMDEFLHVGIAAMATCYFIYNRKQLIADADVGRIVQEALLPHIPEYIAGLDMGYVYASASENALLGGDFLDVFRFNGGKVGFVVGDVSGHGLEAAFGSNTISSLFRGFLRAGDDLVSTVERLNRILPEELESSQFATLVAGTCEGPGRFTIVNAGGPPVILCSGDCCVVKGTNPLLAVFPYVDYTVAELELPENGALIAYTDGLSEARVGGDLFGLEGIISALLDVQDAPAQAIAEHLKDRALHHARGKLSDDMAILVLKRTGGRNGL